MTKGDRIRALRELKGITQDELAKRLETTKQTISKYENNIVTNIPSDKVESMAEIFDTTPDYILGWDKFPTAKHEARLHKDLQPITRTYKLPLLGPVAAGQPINAAPEDGEMIEVPYDPGKADAALTVKGDSMSPRYLNGDVVFIRFQDDVNDGQIAAVCIDDTVTLKKVYHIPNGVYLVSENPAHPPMTYTLEDANNIHIVGLAVGFMRWEY